MDTSASRCTSNFARFADRQNAHGMGTSDRPCQRAVAAWDQTRDKNVLRLRVCQRVYGGGVQNLRGASQENKPQPPLHHIRHQSAIRFCGSGTHIVVAIINNICIFQLSDLSCLVYQKSTNTYAPYNKEWIKEKIYILLRRQASKAN